MKIPRHTSPIRTAENWPRHKAKARKRKATRAHTAHAAQTANDRAASNRL